MFEEEALYYGFHQTLGISLDEMTQSAYDWLEGAKYGFNKANEWHKVSDKLPEMEVFVYLWTNIDNYPMIACRRKKCDEIDWYWDCQGGYYITRLVSVDEGYLWKEIILPKLKE